MGGASPDAQPAAPETGSDFVSFDRKLARAAAALSDVKVVAPD
ncbi:MAG TPA: hypothetical protein VGW34_02770 [Allosphingosinicella sp.]|nr:hypothetical protein [Allosphingosinicella sp.]